MKYKVGDEVRIKGTDIGGTIESIIRGQLIVETKGSKIPVWPEEVVLIEGLVEEPTVFNGEEFLLKLANIELPSGSTTIWECPEGYIFKDENGNVINATKIVLEKKKKEYPKTYEECCRIIGFCSDTLKWDNPFCINRDTHPYIKHLDNLIESFCKLLICRDAYWKIAGEEMGLEKPWKPDWSDKNEIKYCIENRYDKGIHYDNLVHTQKVLAFPTPEMRDAFKDNFDPDIEICKELL